MKYIKTYEEIVSDKEIEDYYQSNLEKVFKKPEMVRASHILIKTKSLDDFLNDEMAKAKIWQLIKI